jgi:hypothetical protein
MKTIPVLLILLFGFPTLHFGQKTHPGHGAGVVDLAQAIKDKLVAITIEGTGGHEGESLKMSCRSLRGQSVRLQVAPGQLMKPVDTTMQILVVAQAQEIFVPAKTPVTIMLQAFCTQAHNRSPLSGTAFSTGAMAPDKICQLLKFLAAHNKVGSPDTQSAIWCVTNGHHLGSISDPEIKKFLSELTGMPIPGYHIQYETKVVPGQPADWGKAMIIDSQFQYTLMTDDKLSLILYDSNNNIVKVLRKDDPAKAGEHRSGLHLQVWTLDPGKYTVRLLKKDGTTIKEMEVSF